MNQETTNSQNFLFAFMPETTKDKLVWTKIMQLECQETTLDPYCKKA